MTTRRTLAVCGLFILGAALYSAYVGPGLPDTVPTHWNASGQADAFGSKWTNLLLMPAIMVLMTLLGGMGTIFGPVIGAFVIIAMQNYLADIGSWVTIVQGIIFVVCVLAFRRGIIGELEHWLRRRRR